MLKNEKKVYYKTLKEELKGKDMIVFNYKGVNVFDLTKMRNEIRKNGATMRVVKNSLLKRYADEAGIKFSDDVYQGMNAVVSISDNYSAIGKILYNEVKTEKISFKAGLYEQKEIDAKYVKTLATIPSKDQLYSMLVGSLQGVVSNLVYTLDSIAEQKK